MHASALFAALALTVLLPLSAAAATVTVRSGETLSDMRRVMTSQWIL